MPTMTTSNGMFLLTHTINAVGDKNIQLDTENTFVDQDILVKITTPAADDLSLDINNNTTDNVTIGTLNTTTNKYPVTATVGGTLTAGTPGWFSTGSGTETGVQVGLIPKATFGISGNSFSCTSPGYITSGELDTITTVTPTASINTGTSNNYNGLTTYFTKLDNSTGANVTIKPQYSTSAGYVSAATNSITTNNITYWKIKTVTPVADTANVTLYTTDGSNAGTNISDIIISTDISETEPNTSGSYYLAFTGSGNSKATSAGWVSSGSFATASKTKYFPVTKAVITASSTNATAETTVAPGTVTILKNGAISVSGKSQILTTVEPSTGTSGISTYFIAIKANAAANNTGATSSISGTTTASVTTAGYAPSNLTGSGSVSGTATAKTSSKDSSVYYIPVPTAGYSGNSASAEITKTTTDSSSTGGVNVGAILGTRATAEPSSGYYISLQASGSGSSKITTAGWLPQDQTLTAASTTVERFFPVTAAQLSVSKVSGSITASASLSQTNVTWSTTDTSGISVTATGNGSVSNLSIKANVSTAGYVPTGDVATANNISISASESPGTETKYLTGVTVGSGKSFTVSSAGTLGVTLTGGTTTVTSSTSNSAGTVSISARAISSSTSLTTQNVVTNGIWVTNTVGNSSNSTYTTKFGRTVVKYGTVSTNFDNSNLLTYFTDDGTSSDYSISITPRYTVSRAGYLAAVTNTAGTIAYYKIRTTSITQGTTTVSGTTATRGTATWGDGWISNGSLSAATFSNTPATGKTDSNYLDISSTTAAPVLVSGSYLYITAGYTDNLKISLAKLVPDSATITVASGQSPHILSGYSAYDNTGALIAGTIPTKTATNLSFDGATRTFTVPSGYYASDATKQIAACTITKGAGAVSLTSDNGDLSIYGTNTHGITIDDNAPASDSGKVYIKVTANGTVTTGVGWNNTSTATTSNNKIRYISLNKYDGSYTIT